MMMCYAELAPSQPTSLSPCCLSPLPSPRPLPLPLAPPTLFPAGDALQEAEGGGH